MFEIGRIVNAGGEHGDIGIGAGTGGRNAFERAAEVFGVVFDRRDLAALEQVRRQLHHGLAVFEHIADTRGGAQIVLKHVKLVGTDAHDIDADDVGVNALGRLKTHHFGAEGGVLQDQLGRNAPGFENFLAVVDVIEKGIERTDALLDAFGQPPPFLGSNNARDDIEGNEFFGPLLRAVDRKGNAQPAKDRLGIALHQGQRLVGLLIEPLAQNPVGFADGSIRIVHFIKRRCIAHCAPHGGYGLAHRLHIATRLGGGVQRLAQLIFALRNCGIFHARSQQLWTDRWGVGLRREPRALSCARKTTR